MVNRDENDDDAAAAAVDRSGEDAAAVVPTPTRLCLLLLLRNPDSHRCGDGLGCRGRGSLEKVGPTGMVNPRRGGWVAVLDVGDRKVLIRRVSEAAKGRIGSACSFDDNGCCFIRVSVINVGAIGTVGRKIFEGGAVFIAAAPPRLISFPLFLLSNFRFSSTNNCCAFCLTRTLS